MEGRFVFPGAKKRALRRSSSALRLLRDLLAEPGTAILEALPIDGVGVEGGVDGTGTFQK